MSLQALRLPFALSSLKFTGIKTFSLLASFAVYALFGAPTPDNPGLAEAIIGVFLVIAVGGQGVYRALVISDTSKDWQKFGAILLVFGVFIPIFVTFWGNNDINKALRDVFSFVFILFPLFLAQNSPKSVRDVHLVLFASVFIGVFFSLRALLPVLDTGIGGILSAAELYYFANVPTVLFSALFLTGSAFSLMAGFSGRPRVFAGLGLMGVAVLPYCAMAANLQRATIGAAVLYLCFIVIYGFWRAPYKTLVPLILMLAALAALWPLIGGLGAALHAKSVVVGMNMRWQEAQAVWAAVSAHPFSLLFGLGWGATFHSPAVGGISVNFTHSLVSAMLLKTGLCGLGLTLLYLAALGRELVRLVINMPVLGLALAAPILINVLLYASYKSLDFGIVLLLVPLSVHLMHARQSRD